jgi:hypothetical protein
MSVEDYFLWEVMECDLVYVYIVTGGKYLLHT